MTKFQVLVSAVLILMQISWSDSYPSKHVGLGTYSYQDSLGHRYEGTIALKDGQVVYSSTPDSLETNPTRKIDRKPFSEETFIPTFLLNFENLLQEIFPYSFDKQRHIMDAAQKALDLTTNVAGNIPNSDFSFSPLEDFTPFTSPADFNMAAFADQGNFGIPNQFINPNPAFGRPPVYNVGSQNRAYASAVATPEFVSQYAGISPMNLKIPNIHETRSAVKPEPGQPQFKSVYSTSFAKSSFVDGQEHVERGAKTYVNDNGKIIQYEVKN